MLIYFELFFELIQVALILFLGVKAGYIKKELIIPPKKINDFVCRFCGSDKEVNRTPDGYLACKKCMVLIFHKV